METSSTEFIEAFRDGADAAWRKVFSDYYRSICYYITNHIRDADEVNELCQLTFLKLYQGREKIKNELHIKNALFLIARRVCERREIVRKPKEIFFGDEVLGKLTEPMAEEIENHCLIDAVMASLEALSPKERAILFQRTEEFRSGKAHDNSFYIKVSRIRAKIRKLIANHPSLQ